LNTMGAPLRCLPIRERTGLVPLPSGVAFATVSIPTFLILVHTCEIVNLFLSIFADIITRDASRENHPPGQERRYVLDGNRKPLSGRHPPMAALDWTGLVSMRQENACTGDRP